MIGTTPISQRLTSQNLNSATASTSVTPHKTSLTGSALGGRTSAMIHAARDATSQGPSRRLLRSATNSAWPPRRRTSTASISPISPRPSSRAGRSWSTAPKERWRRSRKRSRNSGSTKRIQRHSRRLSTARPSVSSRRGGRFGQGRAKTRNVFIKPDNIVARFQIASWPRPNSGVQKLTTSGVTPSDRPFVTLRRATRGCDNLPPGQ